MRESEIYFPSMISLGMFVKSLLNRVEIVSRILTSRILPELLVVLLKKSSRVRLSVGELIIYLLAKMKTI